MNFWILALLIVSRRALAAKSEDGTCDLVADGWMEPFGIIRNGQPPATPYLSVKLLPDFLTCDQVDRLHEICVDRINAYRAGRIPFSNGKFGSDLEKSQPLQIARGSAKCLDEMAAGDLQYMHGEGLQSTPGLYRNSQGCPAFQDQIGQMSCGANVIDGTFDSVVDTIYHCLRWMWDRGREEYTGDAKAHWQIMKNPDFKYASCGFAFAKAVNDGRNLFLVDFHFVSKYTGSLGSTRPPTFASPTLEPTMKPTRKPTLFPTKRPTLFPTLHPTLPPTFKPTKEPTREPTHAPSLPPTHSPTLVPTHSPTLFPTANPSASPTAFTSSSPTLFLTIKPTFLPTRLQEELADSGATMLGPSLICLLIFWLAF